jgi:hypothetical protein
MSSIKTERMDIDNTGARGDRALALRESGLALWQVAQRLGSSVQSAGAMIAKARKRRDAKVQA